MGTFTSFEEVKAWQEGRKLVAEIYAITQQGKFSSDFDLKSQIRRASISIISNIAEGFERQSNKEFAYFLNIAKGSAGEVKAQLYVALDLKYVDQQVFEKLVAQTNEIGKLLGGFIKYLKEKSEG